MLSFGVKVVWFVLSATGLLACWVVLWAFGRAVNMRWGPMLYGFGNTLLQGIFCLGMIYRMDPYRMPRSFCIAQVIIIAFGAFLIAGVSLAFSIATTLTVLKPKTWNDGEQGLKWKAIYIAPIVGFPLVASIVHIVLVIKFDAAQPSEDMHCDSTAPEWVRLFGYAGLPFVMAWPSLYLAVKSIIRISRTNRHLQRARPENDEFTPVPRARTARTRTNFIPSSRMKMVFTPPSPTTPTTPASPRRVAIQPAIASPALMARKFHLPFKAPEVYDGSQRNSSSLSTRNEIPLDDACSLRSQVSMTFPTFVNPDAPQSVLESAHAEDKGTHVVQDEHVREGMAVVDLDWEEGSGEGKDPRDSEQATEREWREDKVGLEDDDEDEDVVAKEEYVMSFSGDSAYSSRSPRPASTLYQPSTLYQHKTKRPIPNLAPAIWRIILFQVAFTSIQFLACISTIIDLARQRTSTSLGTQHFALLLAAWGPVIVFGHLPAVRRNLIPWRPIS